MTPVTEERTASKPSGLRFLAITALFGSALMLSACDDGPAEEAGEAIDDAAEAVEDAAEEAGDAVKDATN